MASIENGSDGSGKADSPARQPEALASFAASARSPDGTPPAGGLAATPETSPVPADPALKAEAAAKVLREGVLGVDEGARDAERALPDRTRSTDG